MLRHLTTPIDEQCNDWRTPLTSSARSFAFDASLTNVSPHTVSPCMNTRVASDNASEPEERFFEVASFRPGVPKQLGMCRPSRPATVVF